MDKGTEMFGIGGFTREFSGVIVEIDVSPETICKGRNIDFAYKNEILDECILGTEVP